MIAPTLAFLIAAGKPSAVGAEVGGALLWHPVEGRELVVGPRLNAFVAQGSAADGGDGRGRTRFDLYSGIEGTLWLVNAIGSGFAVDLAAPTRLTGEEVPTHARFVPMTTVRLKRFLIDGAWSVRVGVPYDTRYKWGVQAGVTLQLGGVPVVGGGEGE